MKRFQKDSEAEHFGAAGDFGVGTRVDAIEVGIKVCGAVGSKNPEETSRNCDFQVFVVGSGEVVAFDLELEAIGAGCAQALLIESITSSCRSMPVASMSSLICAQAFLSNRYPCALETPPTSVSHEQDKR